MSSEDFSFAVLRNRFNPLPIGVHVIFCIAVTLLFAILWLRNKNLSSIIWALICDATLILQFYNDPKSAMGVGICEIVLFIFLIYASITESAAQKKAKKSAKSDDSEDDSDDTEDGPDTNEPYFSPDDYSSDDDADYNDGFYQDHGPDTEFDDKDEHDGDDDEIYRIDQIKIDDDEHHREELEDLLEDIQRLIKAERSKVADDDPNDIIKNAFDEDNI